MFISIMLWNWNQPGDVSYVKRIEADTDGINNFFFFFNPPAVIRTFILLFIIHISLITYGDNNIFELRRCIPVEFA